MEKKEIVLEVCCGSYEDAKEAECAGADRIELNSALYLGGLTPSMGSVYRVKENLNIPVVAMVRPRGGGFFYSKEEYETMLRDARLMLEQGVDGIAFGFLLANHMIDVERTKNFIELIHFYHAEAVFHRAIDCTPDIMEAAETLISLGVDRILTSGGRKTAIDGQETITRLQKEYGGKVEILPGSGLRALNAAEFIRATQVIQLHSSCRGWNTDVTGVAGDVSFGYESDGHETDYEAVHAKTVKELKDTLKKELA